MITTKPVHVYMNYDYDWKAVPFGAKVWTPTISVYKAPDTETSIYVKSLDVMVEIPDDFNPVPLQVAALEAEKAEALAEYQKKVADIAERLSKLLCITNEVETGKEFS